MAENPIRSPEENEVALLFIERLIDLDPPPGTREARWLEALGEMVEAYESVHYLMPCEQEVPDA